MKKMLKVLRKARHPFIVNGSTCVQVAMASACCIQGNTPYN